MITKKFRFAKAFLLVGILIQGNLSDVKAQDDKMVVGDSIKGVVLDENGKGAPFANVALLHSDSTLIGGATTDDDGRFSMKSDAGGTLLKVSYMGYKTCYVTIGKEWSGVAQLVPDVVSIGEVTVKGHRPTVKLTTEGMLTQVDGTLLGQLASGSDVLAVTPGLMKTADGKYEVLGKGEPVFYINGRQVRDQQELQRLKGENIKSITVVTNPGARYNAEWTSVVKIQTKRPVGEGLSGDVKLVYEQMRYGSFSGQTHLNYRHRGLDVFGEMEYQRTSNVQMADMTVNTSQGWEESSDFANRSAGNLYRVVAGLNNVFNENHAIGLRNDIQWPGNMKRWRNSDLSFYGNDGMSDLVKQHQETRYKSRPDYKMNAYYNGKLGKLGVDFNFDYVNAKEAYDENTEELSSSADDRTVNAMYKNSNRMVASKLVFDYPVLGGQLSAGVEYINTRHTDEYENKEHYVPSQDTRRDEQRAAPFVEMNRAFGKWQLSAGLRYEYATFDFFQNGQLIGDVSRSYSQWFPSMTVSTSFGQARMALNYNARTRRPSYSQLSNNMMYISRHEVQTGNPQLKNQTTHNVSLSANWRFMSLRLNYGYLKDFASLYITLADDDSQVIVYTYRNIGHGHAASAVLTLSHRIGFWMPQLTAQLEKQWIKLDMGDKGVQTFNKPRFSLNFTQLFQLPWDMVAVVNTSYRSKGHVGIFYNSKNYYYGEVSLRKVFLNNRLSVDLKWQDMLFSHEDWNASIFPELTQSQHNRWDTRGIVLGLTYQFNQTKSKYKGTGAGNDEKDRF